MSRDKEYLRLLSIFHYIVGGLAALFACFPIIHLITGIFFIVLSATAQGPDEAAPAFVGWIFVFAAGAIMTIGWSIAGCMIAAGCFLSKRKHYLFCLVIACLECFFMPFGTVLGVFTIIVLIRENVERMFSVNPSAEDVVERGRSL